MPSEAVWPGPVLFAGVIPCAPFSRWHAQSRQLKRDPTRHARLCSQEVTRCARCPGPRPCPRRWICTCPTPPGATGPAPILLACPLVPDRKVPRRAWGSVPDTSLSRRASGTWRPPPVLGPRPSPPPTSDSPVSFCVSQEGGASCVWSPADKTAPSGALGASVRCPRALRRRRPEAPGPEPRGAHSCLCPGHLHLVVVPGAPLPVGGPRGRQPVAALGLPPRGCVGTSEAPRRGGPRASRRPGGQAAVQRVACVCRQVPSARPGDLLSL